MRAGLVGCGIVGRLLGARLLRAGHALTVHDRDRTAASALLDAGASWSASLADLAASSEVLLSALPGPSDVEAVAPMLWAAAAPGTYHLETATIGAAHLRTLAPLAAEHGVRLLDAPLSRAGNTRQGKQIVLWVAGDADHFETLRPLLGALAEHVTYCGGLGSAQIAKLVNAVISQSLTLVLGEALALGVKSGVPLELLCAALQNGTAHNRVLVELLPATVFRGDWKPGLTLDLADKDLRLALDQADATGVELTALDPVLRLFDRARRRGWGKDSVHGAVRVIEEQAGVELRSLLPAAATSGDDDGESLD